jgi:hypothetical protein
MVTPVTAVTETPTIPAATRAAKELRAAPTAALTVAEEAVVVGAAAAVAAATEPFARRGVLLNDAEE